WQWCDEVDTSIRHNGWFTDDQQDETIRGLVVRLPHGRMLAGWSMGEHMASEIDSTRVYDDEREAARAADALAERVAEREREYRASDQRQQSARDDMTAARQAMTDAIAALRELGDALQQLIDAAK